MSGSRTVVFRTAAAGVFSLLRVAVGECGRCGSSTVVCFAVSVSAVAECGLKPIRWTSSSIPESVKHLDVGMVREALIRNGARVSNAAGELRVPISDLRKLCLAVPRLMDVAFEP
jgi:hypothetical protein